MWQTMVVFEAEKCMTGDLDFATLILRLSSQQPVRGPLADGASSIVAAE